MHTNSFNLIFSQQQIADYLYENHDWDGENPNVVFILQNEFGDYWQEKAAEYLSWKGLELTQSFESWALANNVDYTINDDGTIGGAYNALISTMANSGNSNCN